MPEKKKKILFFLPGGAGGAERMTITVAKLLPRKTFDVKFVVLGRQKDIYNFIPKDFTVDCIPVHNKYCLSTIRIMLKIISEKPELVFCSQASYNPRVIIAAKMLRMPVIVRSSGMPSTYRKSAFFSVKATYKHADVVIAQQDDMRQEMISLLGVKPSKAITLHNPLDITTIEDKASFATPYPTGNQINYCHVGRVQRDKGHDIAIPAFAKVKEQFPSAHLYFVGKYDEADEYYNILKSKIKELYLEDAIHFVGFDANPYRWMKHCDCFVFPSRREGLPNALIEASYLERPCVAAQCLNIIKEIIKDGENGYVVSVEDPVALTNAMIKAIELKNCKMRYRPANSDDFIQVFCHTKERN